MTIKGAYSTMNEKIKVKELTKIFGKKPKDILKKLVKNQSKDHIF